MAHQHQHARKAVEGDGWLDRVAIGLSGLCLVHCVASGILLVALASAGSALFDPRIHETGLMIAIVLGAVALGRGVRAHGSKTPLLLGGCGLMLMAVGLVVPDGAPEIVATVSGVSLLAYGHHLNRRARLARVAATA